ELQVLDNSHPKYAKLHPAQFHASAYSMAAARRGYQRPVGQWNHQKVTVKGHTIRVELNGYEILNTDLSKLDPSKLRYDLKKFKGRLRTKGYFGFAGHGSAVAFKNVRIKKLD
ncbi:MAG: DUF1080 domain-containing protein, partial [Phycisphaeraceae bacterium]|nr:DUF1080 domain-containing protein [Phycisphaeraceae bacterium]